MVVKLQVRAAFINVTTWAWRRTPVITAHWETEEDLARPRQLGYSARPRLKVRNVKGPGELAQCEGAGFNPSTARKKDNSL